MLYYPFTGDRLVAPPIQNILGGANPAVNTPWPSRGTRIESCDFIVLILVILDSSCLFHFAWPRVSSGSDGLYLFPLSDISPATSDCLEPYFSGGFYFIFQLSRVC